MSHTLALSSDIVQLCGIKATPSGASPRFAFDKADLSDDDHNVLQQLATCMRTERSRARPSSSLGEPTPAEPRSTTWRSARKRAGSVNDYLQSLGVNKSYMTQTSRGALDATGTDEAGWANDRRVDIMLARPRS